MSEQETCQENCLICSACSDQARHYGSDVVSDPKKVRDTGSLGYPFLTHNATYRRGGTSRAACAWCGVGFALGV